MFTETIDESYIIQNIGTSEGSQSKYYKEGYWYKEDHAGNEGLSEYLVSHLLTFSNLPKDKYVIYEKGIINGKPGCRSRNFLKSDEELITIYRLYFNEFGKDLSKVLGYMERMEERIEYTLKFVKESCSIDLTEYLAEIFTLDRIVLNEDRHLNNLAMISDGSRFRPAPIFDNGVSLLTANKSLNRYASISENVKRVIARPFSGSFDKMYEYFGNAILFYKDDAMKWLRDEPESLERDVLLYQFDKYAMEI